MNYTQLLQCSTLGVDGSTRGSFDTALDLRVIHLESAAAIVIKKSFAGLTQEWVNQVRDVLQSAADGHLGALKFLVFDLASEAEPNAPRAENVHLLIGEVANLILDAPIVTVAHIDKFAGGADLELALACSMLICDEHSRFSFAADPTVSIAAYALLAQKIGFVRAERLMEGEQILTAGQMRDLYLLKETIPAGSGSVGIDDFLLRASRRHNSAAAMYRAQRIATPLVAEIFGKRH